ncbi:response regulator [Sesbania bispinosa]|nr:response regulator [Sesbania bispinosa]
MTRTRSSVALKMPLEPACLSSLKVSFSTLKVSFNALAHRASYKHIKVCAEAHHACWSTPVTESHTSLWIHACLSTLKVCFNVHQTEASFYQNLSALELTKVCFSAPQTGANSYQESECV